MPLPVQHYAFGQDRGVQENGKEEAFAVRKREQERRRRTQEQLFLNEPSGSGILALPGNPVKARPLRVADSIPLAQEAKNSCCCSETFGHIEKNIPAWRKKLGFYGKTEHFKMPFVSIADKICSQTQKNAKFWVWSILISNIEKICGKTCIFPLEFS